MNGQKRNRIRLKTATPKYPEGLNVSLLIFIKIFCHKATDLTTKYLTKTHLKTNRDAANMKTLLHLYQVFVFVNTAKNDKSDTQKTYAEYHIQIDVTETNEINYLTIRFLLPSFFTKVSQKKTKNGKENTLYIIYHLKYYFLSKNKEKKENTHTSNGSYISHSFFPFYQNPYKTV